MGTERRSDYTDIKHLSERLADFSFRLEDFMQSSAEFRQLQGTRLERIETKLDGVTTKKDHDEIVTQVKDHGARIGSLEKFVLIVSVAGALILFLGDHPVGRKIVSIIAS
jgi:hypothetical protein